MPLIDSAGASIPLRRVKSRWQPTGTSAPRTLDRRALVAEYWEALKAALADLSVTDAEVSYLLAKQSALGLTIEEVRSLHARVFAGILADVTDDNRVNEEEVNRIAAMAEGLRRLGWAPGDGIAPVPTAAGALDGSRDGCRSCLTDTDVTDRRSGKLQMPGDVSGQHNPLRLSDGGPGGVGLRSWDPAIRSPCGPCHGHLHQGGHVWGAALGDRTWIGRDSIGGPFSGFSLTIVDNHSRQYRKRP